MLVPEGLDHALEWVKAAIGAVKQPKRDWKQLAADPQTAGELLLTWAAGRSSRGGRWRGGLAGGERGGEAVAKPECSEEALAE